MAQTASLRQLKLRTLALQRNNIGPDDAPMDILRLIYDILEYIDEQNNIGP